MKSHSLSNFSSLSVLTESTETKCLLVVWSHELLLLTGKADMNGLLTFFLASAAGGPTGIAGRGFQGKPLCKDTT